MKANEIKIGAVIRNRRSGKTWEVVETPPGEWPRAKIRSPRTGRCHFESIAYLTGVCDPVDNQEGRDG